MLGNKNCIPFLVYRTLLYVQCISSGRGTEKNIFLSKVKTCPAGITNYHCPVGRAHVSRRVWHSPLIRLVVRRNKVRCPPQTTLVKNNNNSNSNINNKYAVRPTDDDATQAKHNNWSVHWTRPPRGDQIYIHFNTIIIKSVIDGNRFFASLPFFSLESRPKLLLQYRRS